MCRTHSYTRIPEEWKSRIHLLTLKTMFFFWIEIKHYKFSPKVIASHRFKWQERVDGEGVGGKAEKTRTALAILLVRWQ